jgi:hypothetical protein
VIVSIGGRKEKKGGRAKGRGRVTRVKKKRLEERRKENSTHRGRGQVERSN